MFLARLCESKECQGQVISYVTYLHLTLKERSLDKWNPTSDVKKNGDLVSLQIQQTFHKKIWRLELNSLFYSKFNYHMTHHDLEWK